MNMTNLLAALPIFGCGTFASDGQGGFQNLDFESANTQPGQVSGVVSAADAIPGWTPYLGTNGGNAVLFNQPSVGS